MRPIALVRSAVWLISEAKSSTWTLSHAILNLQSTLSTDIVTEIR